MVINLKIEQKNSNQNLYETDYNLWIIETVKNLKKGDFQSIDLENLIEEVFDLSRRQQRKIESLLTRLFEHLLKLKYWQSEINQNKGHWEAEIINFRKQIKKELKSSPSLKLYLSEVFEECYQDGRDIVSKRTQLPIDIFPLLPIGNMEQILDENWLP